MTPAAAPRILVDSAVPATDLMIAAIALDHECQLWHLDAHFERIARVAPLQQRKFR